MASAAILGSTALVGVALGVRTWQRRGTAWRSLIGIAGGVALWAGTLLVGGYGSPSVAERGLAGVGVTVAVLGWTLSVVALVEERLLARDGVDRQAIATAAKVSRGVLGAWPVAFVALFATNGGHGLVLRQIRGASVVLGPAIRVNTVYVFLGILLGAVVMFGIGVELAVSTSATRRVVSVLVAAQVGVVALVSVVLTWTALLPVHVTPLGLALAGFLLAGTDPAASPGRDPPPATA